jgi:uncharacterized protein
MLLSELYIYPVKSLGGIALTESRVLRQGLQYDRRWMLTDADGVFISQREIPEMALLCTALENDALVVWHRHHPDERLHIPLLVPDDLPEKQLTVWNDTFRGKTVPGIAAEWFSDVLKSRIQLAFLPETGARPADARYAPAGQSVSFADGFPFLLIGQTSLADLNSRLTTPLPMNRFRPNFVVTGSAPFEEDQWKDIRIGQVAFACVKPCARCSITTTDQLTAERGPEPIRTLATFRMVDKKILFGQNVIWTGEGDPVVRVGDEIIVMPQ